MTKKNLLTLLLCFILCLSCFSLNVVNASKNDVLKKAKLERVVIKSDLLKKKMNVIVYLPKGYGDGRQYPVLYFIHGFGKDENLLTEVGLDQKATALIEADRINPLIIVAPQMDNSWGLNSATEYKYEVHNSEMFHYGMYEDYFLKEVVPYIDSKYNMINDRNGRYIGGSSMGGYIALYYGLRHSELFSKIGGHMPSVKIGSRFSWFVYPTQESSMERDLTVIADSKDLTNLNIYLDCGESDSLLSPVNNFYLKLLIKGVKASFDSSEGTHSSAYIKANAEKYLFFYAGK